MQRVETKRIPAFMQTLPKVKFWFYDSTQVGKEEYPTDPDQHRLINYESCRRLEGWTVVCLGFDTFVQDKLKNHSVQDKTLLEIDDPETIARRNAYLWSIIPLTRPIDTLIITLDNPDSEVALILKDIAREFSDFVEWIE